MKLSIKSFLTSCAIVAGMATTSAAQGKFVKAEDFGQKLGRAKKDHHIEANILAGPFAFKYIGYSLAYGYIYNDGIGEINVPFSIQSFGNAPTPVSGTQAYSDVSNLVIGTGLKIRRFNNEIDEGMFVGGGLRIWHIMTSYSRSFKNEPTKFEFSFQNWSPLAEVGYTQKFTTNFGANYSMELGGSFSTYEPLIENTNEQTNVDNPGDPGHTPAFDYTGVYYAINIGAFYAF